MELFNSIRFCYKAKGTPVFPDYYLKILLGSLIIVATWGHAYAQEEDIFQGELTKINKEVKSPESRAFELYGDPEVSLYTGVPQISVPLHVIDGREFSLPVSLTYDASGVQVEQLATWVGLSWNLNLGGRISRVTNGLPDDYISGTYTTMFNDTQTQQTAQSYIDDYASVISNPQFPNAQAAIDYAQFLLDINYNRIDTQVDHFKLSAPGLNTTVVLEKNTGSGFTARALNNPRIKISFITAGLPNHISSWTVTNEDGTKYIFSGKELAFRQNLGADAGDELMGDANTTYISAWLLTQIVSKNGKDVFDFTYEDEGYEPQRGFATAAGSVTTEIINNVYTYSEPPIGNISNVVSSIKQLFPSEIRHNDRLVIELNRGLRKDLDVTDVNKRLESINFINWEGNTIKSVALDNNHYFNSDGLTNANIFSTGKVYSDIRLKLDGITIKGSDNNNYENYYFDYHDPDDLPSLASNAQDYFGYYNGANNNNSLYERVELDNFIFQGADRNPSFNDGIKGTLKKITYPTGGHSEFTFESHKIFTSQSNSSEDAVMNILLTQNSPTTPNLYRNDQGILCDDKYVSPFDPRIVIQTFYVIEEDDYTLSLTSSNNDFEFYLVDPTNISAPYNNYCDFFNGPGSNNVVGPFYSNASQTVHLTPGKYKAMLLLGNLNSASSFNAWAKISRNVTTVNWVNKDIGGQRISSIKSYTSLGNLATQKTFDYTTHNPVSNFDESTGSINYIPILHTFRENSNAENGPKSQLIRYSTYAKGSEPYVVYSSVKESMTGNLGQTLGVTTHNFFNGQVGSVPMNTPPYENWYFPSLEVGNLSSKTISDENNGLVTEHYGYYETLQRPISIESMVVYVDNDNFQKTIFLKNNDNGTPSNTADDYVTYEYLDTFECVPNGGGGIYGTLCAWPDYYSNYQNYGYVGRLEAKFSPYRARVSKTNGAYGGLNYYKKESSFYDANGDLISNLSSEEHTAYDNNETSPQYLPRKKTVTDSKGNVIETRYTYPHDGVVNGSTTMVNKNMLSEIVMTETIMNPGIPEEQDLFIMRKDYGSFGTAVMPNAISTTKNGDTSIPNGEFDFYPGGNIKYSRRPDGPSTYYIWGYDSELAIAKISNFDDADASSLQSLITACQSASDADDGTTNAENTLRNALENLRAALPDGALMTGYTYDPTIGVTSIMDPRGYVTFYEYDPFNRLKNVKDDDLKLLNDYQYHYKGQN